jgi:beta-lactamase regulating signal transducer with metallopeptidase domain
VPNLPEETTAFLASWALLGAIVITAAWILARVGWAGPRPRIGLLAVAAIVVLAPLTRSLWPDRPALPIDPVASVAVEIAPSQGSRAAVQQTVLAANPPGDAEPTPSPLPIAETLIVLWWIGAAVAWVRLGRSIVSMNCLRRSAERREGLLRSRALTTPVAAGFPVSEVIVPSGWPSPFSPEEAAAALHHETAHVQGRHVAIRVFGEALAGWFWWLPTAWLSTRVLEEALEEIADQRTFGQRIALASALVRLSESRLDPPRLCSGIASSSTHLERRVLDLLENRPMKPYRKLLAVLAVTLFAFGGVIAAGSLFGQSAESGPYGLVPGAKWTYETIAENGERSSTTTVVSRAIPFGKSSVFELVSQTDRYTTYAYVSADPNGYWTYYNSRMQGPGFVRNEGPEPLWKLPLTAGKTWKFRQPFRGQIMDGPEGAPNMDDLAFDCTAKVVAASEPIEVPAGKYRAAHVRIDRVSKANGANSTDLWVVEGIGIVRSIDRYSTGTYERRLTHFAPGKPAKIVVPQGYTRITQESVVDALADVYAYGPLERGRRTILRLGAVNQVFDAMNEGNASEAAFRGPNEGGYPTDRLNALAVLAALQNGAEASRIRIADSRFSADAAGAQRFDVVVEDGRRRFTVRYRMTKNAVQSVQIEIGR